MSSDDIFRSINFDVIGDTFYAQHADSIGKYYSLIKSSEIDDFGGRKPAMNYCFVYYEGKERDSIAKAKFKNT